MTAELTDCFFVFLVLMVLVVLAIAIDAVVSLRVEMDNSLVAATIDFI